MKTASIISIDISSRVEQSKINNGELIGLKFKLGKSIVERTVGKDSFDMIDVTILVDGVPTVTQVPEILFLTSVYNYVIKPLEIGNKILTPKFENGVFNLLTRLKNSDGTYTEIFDYNYQLILSNYGRETKIVNLALNSNVVSQAEIDGAAFSGFTISNVAEGIQIVSEQKEFNINIIRNDDTLDVWSDVNGFNNGEFKV